MSYPVYGQFAVGEPPSNLLSLHLHDGSPLKTVDHEPKVGVLDQSDLFAQGIHTSTFIPGAKDADALGSCTANANTAALSNILDRPTFEKYVYGATSYSKIAGVYDDVVAAEEAAIRFYHICTDQSGDPATEWPPTDCGSSGPYIVSENVRLGLCSGQQVAHGAQNLVSLLQTDGVLIGSPFLNAWETPDANGFVDGDGSAATLRAQLHRGIAGGHETYICAVEKLGLDAGRVIASETILRVRNSWSRSWGDAGDYRIHLSTIVAFGSHIDLRQLVR